MGSVEKRAQGTQVHILSVSDLNFRDSGCFHDDLKRYQTQYPRKHATIIR